MIKINLELPEFDKELSISVTLRKDGEVISTSSSSPGVVAEVFGGGSSVSSRPDIETENTKPTTRKAAKKTGSNLMDMSF